jgi:signal transduction histidine kinase
VAHELKTPLAVIHGYTEGLQENIAEEKKDQYLATILSESERMDKLVMEMLDLSRLEAGKVKLARDTFSLTELIQSVFDRLSREMEKKSLHLTFDLHCEGQIHADEGRMEQVILNLASNAVRYTPAGGHIRVRTEKKVGMVFFYMENDATPFAEEELTKVWETFYRTDRARNGKGTGLGLAIVKNIIKLHGGTCYARNTQSGVEFSFHIPQI